MSLRMEKINSQIRKEIAEIIRQEIEDPRAGMISITRVETTVDLQEAKVHFSVLGDNFSEVEKILNDMSSFIRVHLGKRIRLRILPRLTFVPDNSLKYSVEICKKIEEIRSAEEDTKNNREQ